MIEKIPIIDEHPSAEIPIDGLVSRLIQAGEQQFVFMEFETDTEVALHSHEAQWGVVLDGEMELTIGKQVLFLKKGDTYYINKGELHSAKIKAGYKDLTLFNQKDRYKTQSDT
ncbi:cupin domain-containing protein [Carboxylicivirga sediminis]|uniref:Cupin domain-containing protein n=1 Tax=Carboxylicivirga sediminis TaxID=2006564 RepID=A0A941F6Z9_9BACT|nr:cupin domain-containing protein [Carboxylicivirga sediminis]MBR8537727.1 cupin domain-containing protein [Carboxylicivirga sediminis]